MAERLLNPPLFALLDASLKLSHFGRRLEFLCIAPRRVRLHRRHDLPDRHVSDGGVTPVSGFGEGSEPSLPGDGLFWVDSVPGSIAGDDKFPSGIPLMKSTN
jgi:hypothetical protein